MIPEDDGPTYEGWGLDRPLCPERYPLDRELRCSLPYGHEVSHVAQDGNSIRVWSDSTAQYVNLPRRIVDVELPPCPKRLEDQPDGLPCAGAEGHQHGHVYRGDDVGAERSEAG